jgi:chromate transporter
VAAGLLVLFAALLVILPMAREATGDLDVAVADSFYRAGSLVFGGGHVVLPLLQAEVVPPGWVDDETFIAGYGAAQAVPGPLFTFAAYLGAVAAPGGFGIGTAILALVAIFVPSFLLVLGALPFWDRLRSVRSVQAALMGVNAVVVGILLAALYHPVWTSAIFTPSDFALALGAFTALAIWKWPAWLVVIASALVAGLLGAVVGGA